MDTDIFNIFYPPHSSGRQMNINVIRDIEELAHNPGYRDLQLSYYNNVD